MNVLVVAAHPDDEVLGCGGTMARLADEGHNVGIVILGEGATARFDRRRDAPRRVVANLRRYCRQSARILGVQKVWFFALPDNRFDTLSLLDIVKQLEKLKAVFRPEVVYTHFWGDLNVDHRIAYQAVLTAFRPIRGETVRRILTFEVPSSTEWNIYGAQNTFTPNTFSDVSRTVERKIEAFSRYRGEAGGEGHPRSPEAIRIYARRWGYLCGLEAAEAFVMVRCIES